MNITKKQVLKIGISYASYSEVLEYITKGLKNNTKKRYIVTPNPELLMLAHSNNRYKSVLNRADLALPDGVGVMWAAKILGKPLKERIAGVGMVEKLCKEVSKKPITVGFLGGRQNVAVKTAECLQKKYPELKVAYVGGEWMEGEVKSKNSKFKSSEKKNINPSIDILFVAFGSPKQELWIADNLEKLPVKVAIGVGGAFDFISGRIKRAPIWVQNLGFEWLYRLIRQPWRIKRQARLIMFAYLVLRQKFLN
ncbi:WecB/TagA/CpsF family glycosyltransferase [Patescibacteria group bacterium]|nr:WecB/TagA/CpsF family glycosyltransferase [Patescibacteria group bacterium]